jgi:pimeloyl-ACP methyl ester carboxylesterase
MKRLIFILCLSVISVFYAKAGDWQYSVPIHGGDAMAWLWIPPTCKTVKGIVMAQQVILDKYALENSIMRKMAEENDLAFILVNPIFWTPSMGAESLTFINDLAQISGYSELAIAPILTIGHSGGAIWAWHAAYCMPDRVVAAIGLHAAPIFPPEWAPKLTLEGVPVLSISGQYETWDGPSVSAENHWKWVRGAGYYFRGRYPNALFSEIVEPGTGHFFFLQSFGKISIHVYKQSL